MKRLIVFGGSFNPPTKAHKDIARLVLNETGSDKLIFVPVGDSYGKSSLIGKEHRFNLLESMVKTMGEQFGVSRVELDSEKQLKTIETLRLVKSEYRDYEILFLMGADNLKDFTKWYKPEEFLREFKIIAMNRGSFDLEEAINKIRNLSTYKSSSIIKIDIKGYDEISSTIVREYLSKDLIEEVESLISEEVIDYIKKNKLYIGGI